MSENIKTIRDQLPGTSKSCSNINAPGKEELLAQIHIKRKYKKIKFISRGGMGEINLAQDRNCLRNVAIKSLDESYRQDHEAIVRFTEEAQITAQLEHPNIVPIYDLGLNDKQMPYYAMKHIHGKNLSQIIYAIKRGNKKYTKNFSIRELINIILKVCNAMNSACSKGVLHRDLKPENIMIGEYGEVTIVDWGLAKVMSAEAQPQKTKHNLNKVLSQIPVESVRSKNNVILSMNNVLIGTPAFMSPERITGEGNEQSEVYAIGCILYYVLSLEHMFSGTNIRTMLTKICKGEYLPLSHFNSLPHLPHGKIPSSLSAVVDKAVHFEADKRYKSIVELRHDLEAYLQGYATGAEDAGLGKTVSLSIKRHKRLSIFISILCMIILSALIISIISVRNQANIAEKTSHDAKNIEIETRKKSLEASAKALELSKNIAELKKSAPVLYSNALKKIEVMELKIALSYINHAITLKSDSSSYFETKAYLHLSFLEFEDFAQALQNANQINQKKYEAEWALVKKLKEQKFTKNHLKDIVELLSARKRFSMALTALENMKKQSDYRHLLRTLWLKKLMPTPIGQQLITKVDNISIVNNKFHVTLSGQTITSLKALTKMPISKLSLKNCTTTDITPLKTLPLESIIINQCPITDLSPLKDKKLKYVELVGAKITSLHELSSSAPEVLVLQDSKINSLDNIDLSNLKKLNISASEITDLSPLKGVPLQELTAENCKIKDLTPLHSAKLTHLYLDSTSIESLHGLENQNILRLEIQGTAIKDLTPLKNSKLEYLNINHSRVSSLEALIEHTTLKVLRMRHTRINNLSPLANSNIEHLDISENNIKDIKPIFKKSLRRLQMDGSTIHSIKGISQAVNLRDLSAKEAFFNFKDLSESKSIQILDLQRTQIKSLNPLEHMKLIDLQLNHAIINDLTALTNMKSLKHLEISSTQIDDLSPLTNLNISALLMNQCVKVRDLTPLANNKYLTYIELPNHLSKQDLKILTTLTKLEKIKWRSRTIQADILKRTLQK
jgi:serine/threonine protein kinase